MAPVYTNPATVINWGVLNIDKETAATIASIDAQGLLSATGAGTVEVFAYVGDIKSDYIEITIPATYDAVTGIVISGSSEVAVGATAKFTAELEPVATVNPAAKATFNLVDAQGASGDFSAIALLDVDAAGDAIVAGVAAGTVYLVASYTGTDTIVIM